MFRFMRTLRFTQWRKKRRIFAGPRPLAEAALGLCLVLWSCSNAFANPFQETIRILENSTSFHWGRDCLVWIVYYPEELVDPWVDSEAGRVGMTESERESYKKGFVSELSLGKMEPFLFTVYAFGPRPLDFSPISEKIALVTAEGERVKPARYDQVFDRPISGVVQGLVFFPKQRSGDFALAVQGMGVYDERIFAFSSRPAGAENAPAKIPQAETSEDNAEVVIVDLPPTPGSGEEAVSSAPAPKETPKQRPRRQEPKVIERPSPPPPKRAPEPKIVVIEPEESQSMAEFVESMRSGDRRAQEAEKQDDKQEADNLYASREKTLRTFLGLWVKHDPETMYSMLSESSQKLFSRETFESELRKASDFRGALQDGYTIEWLGTERAKVVAVKRILLIRTLVGRTLGVAREGSAWKIVW
ncbi:MAG: hypothetical protein LBS00_00255 [Synergistaceae bacterium]|jgi:hypothetical protein|nr:hypothetical protein [Synergistaceae bacterium]